MTVRCTGRRAQLEMHLIRNCESDKLAFSGDVQTEELDAVKGQNIRLEELVARSVEIKGVQYAYDPTTTVLYDWSSYEEGEPRQVGKLIKSDGDYIVELL